MTILHQIHAVADYLLSWVKLEQNAAVGWPSFNRRTEKLEREQQPLWKKLKLLVLFNPLMEWLDRTHLMRLYMHEESVAEGRRERTPGSRRRIRAFVDAYDINMRDFDPEDADRYPTFEDFFTRAHRAGSRPISNADDPRHAIVVADSRVVVFESVHDAKALWIKGKNFSLANLVMDNQVADLFEDAAIASFRLSPQDYHRFHSPVAGEVSKYQSLPGDYYQVDPVALRSKVDILTRNRRDYVIIETDEFGPVLFVAIGATDVGSVRIHEKYRHAGPSINKGDELGMFEFGGSSIIVAFQKGHIKFDHDLLEMSGREIQTSVEVGMSLGHAA